MQSMSLSRIGMSDDAGVLFRDHYAYGTGKSGRHSSEAVMVLFARVYETAEEAGCQNRECAASTREGVDEYGFLGPISEKDAEIS